MPVALGNGVGALLGEDGHELFEGSERFAHDEVNPHSVAPDKIGRERSIVEGIVPVPALTALVIVRENPLEALNVGLFDSFLERQLVLWCVHMELIGVVSCLVAHFSQLDSVDILGDKLVALGLSHALHLILDGLLDLLKFVLVVQPLQTLIQLVLSLLEQCFLRFLGLLDGHLVQNGLISRHFAIRIRPFDKDGAAPTATPSPTPTPIIGSKPLFFFQSLLLQPEKFFLILRDVLEEHIAVAKVDRALVGQVPVKRGQRVFIHRHDGVKSAFPDLQRWQVGQEIVPHEEAQKDKIVNQALKVKPERQLQVFELQVEVLSHHRNLDELELGDARRSVHVFCVAGTAFRRNVPGLATFKAFKISWLHDRLSQDVEMGLMRGQAQHN